MKILEAVKNKLDTTKRIVLLPPFPLNAIPFNVFEVTIYRLSPDELKEIISVAKSRGIPIISFIRHPSTVKLLSKIFGLDLQVSSDLYHYSEGDILVLIGLKKPIRGQEMEVTINDLDIAVAWVMSLDPIFRSS